MLKPSRWGEVIYPSMPPFAYKRESLDDLVKYSAARPMGPLDLALDARKRWTGLRQARAR